MAVKIVPRQAFEKAEKEVDILLSLDHTNIVGYQVKLEMSRLYTNLFGLPFYLPTNNISVMPPPKKVAGLDALRTTTMGVACITNRLYAHSPHDRL